VIGEKSGEASSPARFTLQIGAFRYEENAHERMLILKSLGYTPYLFQPLDPKGRPWFTVRMGGYTHFEQAAASLQAYEKTSIFPAVILPVDSLFPAGGNLPGPS